MAGTISVLRVNEGKIVDEGTRPVRLKGVSLGGWLMMEGYMMGGRNLPEKLFKGNFEKALGHDALDDFTQCFREAFIREEDFAEIKSWGANCIRIPFNYRLLEFEDKPFSLNEKGLDFLDKAVEWCIEHGLYCIIDMHALPGAQNPDWHSDCMGKPEFFTNEFNQNRYYRLWHFIANRYKNVPNVAGYDVMNEPVLPLSEEGRLKDVYEKVTKEIRDTGSKQIIFLEGNIFGQRIKPLGKPKDDNTAYSVHAYPPPPFVFHLEPSAHYPGRIYGIMWNRQKFELLARPYHSFVEGIKVPLYVGEFGVNARDGYYGELKWVKDALDIFKKFGWSWTYWTYKTVANYIHPDGIYRYVKNPPWIHREGPLSGLETFADFWPKEKGRMISSWRTQNYVRNDKLLAVLKKEFASKR
jgi:aryl-phospho-beta-D-glucosidase BglC (GH1 family)